MKEVSPTTQTDLVDAEVTVDSTSLTRAVFWRAAAKVLDVLRKEIGVAPHNRSSGYLFFARVVGQIVGTV